MAYPLVLILLLFFGSLALAGLARSKVRLLRSLALGKLAVMLLERYHLGSAVAGGFGIAGAAGALAAPLAGGLADKLGAGKVTQLGALLVTVSFALMFLMPALGLHGKAPLARAHGPQRWRCDRR